MEKSRFRLKVAKLWLKGPAWGAKCPSNTARRMDDTHPFKTDCRWTCHDCVKLFPELQDTMEEGGMLDKCPCLALGANWVKTRAKLYINGELDI